MSGVDYSIGRNRFDPHPKNYTVRTFDDMEAHVSGMSAADKASAGYVAAAFSGSRSARNSKPCAWIAVDVDAINPAVHADFRLHLCPFRGFGWPTASSTPDAPRERFILQLSEPVDREARIAIGAALSADLETEFGSEVCIDPCTYRPEQPCFLRLRGTRPFFLVGEPLSVSTWLKQAPPPPAEPPAATAAVVAMADARVRVLMQQLAAAGMLTKPLANGRGHAIRCPWERHHTTPDEPGTTATALLFPSDANGWRGGFRCLHSHCQGRRLGDLTAVLRRAEELARSVAA